MAGWIIGWMNLNLSRTLIFFHSWLKVTGLWYNWIWIYEWPLGIILASHPTTDVWSHLSGPVRGGVWRVQAGVWCKLGKWKLDVGINFDDGPRVPVTQAGVRINEYPRSIRILPRFLQISFCLSAVKILYISSWCQSMNWVEDEFPF